MVAIFISVLILLLLSLWSHLNEEIYTWFYIIFLWIVARIALVKPEKARGVEDVILRAAQSGQIAEKVHLCCFHWWMLIQHMCSVIGLQIYSINDLLLETYLNILWNSWKNWVFINNVFYLGFWGEAHIIAWANQHSNH